MKKTAIFFLIIIMIISNRLNVKASQHSIEKENLLIAPHHLLTDGLISGYQRFVSPINHGSCPMHPNCSGHARESFKQYNFFKAFLDTGDRLLRCGNDLDKYDIVDIKGMIRYNDKKPLEEISMNVNGINFVNKRDRNGNFDDGVANSDERLLYYFAKELQANKEYDEAIVEYKRLLSYYPESFYRSNALESIFGILYIKEDYFETINFGIDILSSQDKRIVDKDDIKLTIGLSYLNINNFNLARKYLKQIKGDYKLADKLFLLIGFSFAYEENWEEAKEYFYKVNNLSEFHEIAQRSIVLADEGKDLGYKNPKLAAGLSLVPGLGYLYSGYKDTALSSFLVNGIFLLSTNKAFENDNKALGYFLGSFGLGFYAGNIYGSYTTAENRNEMVRRDYLLKFNFEF